MDNKEFKQAWLDALRSGEYEQGVGALKQHNWDSDTIRHCCLGVACEVAKKMGLELDEHVDSQGVFFFNGNEGSLPLKVREFAGIGHDDTTSELVRMNDHWSDFPTIADYIEKEM